MLGLAVVLLLPGGARAASLAGSGAVAAQKERKPAAKKREALAKRRKASAKRRAVRRRLLRQVRRNPAVVRRPGFLRRASHVALDLPVTFRLNPKIDDDLDPSTPLSFADSDDLLELDVGADPTTAPFPAGVEAGATTTWLAGQFNGAIRFGRSTLGYGALGLTELSLGRVDMAAGGVPLVKASPPCADGGALLRAGTIFMTDSPVQPSDRRGGTVNLISGSFNLKLYVQATFNSLRRGADACGNPYFWTGTVPLDAPPPMVLQMSGDLAVSPAITSDGSLRLFTVRAEDAVTPQPSLAATLLTCTAATADPGTGPPPATTCAGEPLDARAKVLRFTAELLIGDRPPEIYVIPLRSFM